MNYIKLEQFDISVLRGGMEVNIVVGSADPEIVELMFQPDGTEIFIQAPDDITWPQLLAALGCFSSVSQARKNWCQGQKNKSEIMRGLEQVTVGKARRIFISVYKPFHDYAPQEA